MSDNICDAYEARCEVNASRVNYIAQQYTKISKAARKGEIWCQLDHHPDSQMEGLLIALLENDGYTVWSGAMIASWY